jgi:Rps23 Pro-64 3,4-dihydroxylase Tpa1-like proline 4-hydroxylase
MDKIQLNNINYLIKPFPHCVIDNFFVTYIANELYENINSLKLKDADSKFTNKKSLHEYNKFAFSEIEKLPLSLKNIFMYLNSKEFIAELEKLTGIYDIVYGDIKLQGAGVHIIKDKGFLDMHTDFNTYKHPTHGILDRRINLLLYMNKDWKSEYKGDLLMYSPDNTSEVKRIYPIFNRCVIFNTTNKSVHGHPEPLCVPKEDLYRKSIAVYYYTKNKQTFMDKVLRRRPVDFEGDHIHSTLWHKTLNI